MVLFTAELADSRVQIREHHLYLSSQYLVSVHLEPSEPLVGLRERIKSNPDLAHRSLPYLFYLVVDHLVDSLFPVLEKLDDATDEVEEGIIKRPDTAALSELSDLKRAVVDLRKVLGAQRDVFQRLTTRAIGEVGDQEMSIYYRDVYDHLVRQYETVDSLRDLLSTSMDVYLSTVSNRLNLRITRLTVFSTLFLPLTFISGFFGMNFGWYRTGLDLLAAGGRDHGPDNAGPALLLPPQRLDLTRRGVDDAAGNLGVLVEVVAGADPMVAVGDGQGDFGLPDPAANQQDRR
ncbi:MAG: magnesium transporter CorA family protein [Chloroflexi bacterium]|nr:MAG: magnesium transporter CorA family protein [Chloroflexota bacterium]